MAQRGAHRAPRAVRVRWARFLALVALVVLVLLLWAAAAHASPRPALAAAAVQPPPASLNEVIDRLRAYVVTLLAALATLFATVGGVRYLMAGSDPTEVAKAKAALKFAAVGYAVAVLAPLLVNILKGIVGGP